jgi:hypothetical protein
MLSSQTKNEVTDAAVDDLRAGLGGTDTLERFLSAQEPENVPVVADYYVVFWRQKTKSVPFSLPVHHYERWVQVHKAGGAAPTR